jgi:hypothetical protein
LEVGQVTKVRWIVVNSLHFSFLVAFYYSSNRQIRTYTKVIVVVNLQSIIVGKLAFWCEIVYIRSFAKIANSPLLAHSPKGPPEMVSVACELK